MIGSDLEDKSYEATKDVNEMLKTNLFNPKVNVVLETGGSTGKPDKNNNRTIDFSKVQRHQIVDDNIKTISDLGKVNMGENKTLSDFLNWGVTKFPAKKYGMILWDHGGSLDGYGKDVNFNDKLHLSELDYALKNVINKDISKSVEFIGFDACLMASLEVASKLSDTYPLAKYLIASEEIEPNWGWNYTVILDTLFNQSYVSGELIGKNIIDSYVFDSQRISKNEQFGADREITLSIIDLYKVSYLKENLDQLVRTIIDETIQDKSSMLKLLRSIDATEHYGQNGINSMGVLDIYDFITNIEYFFPVLKEKIGMVKNALELAIKSNYAGESSRNANGLSIYLPLSWNEFEIKKYYVDNKLILPTYGLDWLGLVLYISMILDPKIDQFLPIIKSERSEEGINVNVQGSDISNIYLHKILNSSNGELIQYIQNLDHSDIDENGFFTFGGKILGLCNEKLCLPVSTKIDTSRDEKIIWILADIVSPSGKIQEVSLPYTLENGDFIFLGGVEKTRVKGDPLPKEKISLKEGDKIYPTGMSYNPQKETFYITNAQTIFERINNLYQSSKVEDKYLDVTNPLEIKPNYIDVNSSTTKIVFCDYTNNCDTTRTYDDDSTSITLYHNGTKSFVLEPKTTTSNNISNSFLLYINDEYDFQLNLPSDWISFTSDISKKYESIVTDLNDSVDPQAASFIPVSEYLNYSGNLMPGLLLMVQDSKYFDDPKRLFNFLDNVRKKENLKNALDYEIISSNKTSINGYPAFEYILKSSKRSDTEMGIQEKRSTYTTSIIANQKEYTLSFEIYDSKFPKYLPIVKKIVSSFQAKDFDVSSIDLSKYRLVDEKQILTDLELSRKNNNEYQLKNYVDPKYNFTITYPSKDLDNIQIVDNDLGYLVAIPLPENKLENFNLLPIVMISIFELPSDYSGDLSLLNEESFSSPGSPSFLSKVMPNFNLLENISKIRIGEDLYSVYEMSYFMSPMGQVNEKAVQTIIDDKYVRLSIAVSPDDYEEYEKIFDDVAKTFKFIENTN
jgi:hypothetical protein